MVKKIRKVLTICLAAVLCMSLIPATVFAEPETTTTVDEQGLTVVTVKDTVTEIDENGNVVVKVILDETKTGVTVDGIIIDSYRHREDTTVTNSNGEEIGTSFKENGTKREEWDGDVEPGDDTSTIPAIKVEIQGEADENGNVTVSGSATGTPVTKTEDNKTTTTTANREVNGTQNLDITVEHGETKYEATVAPENYDGKNWNTGALTGSYNKHNPQRDGVAMDNPTVFKQGQSEKPEGEGYDFFLSGSGEYTDAAAPLFKKIVYQRDENGNPIPDGNGGYLIDEEKSKLIDGSQGKAPGTGMDYLPSQLALTYKDGSVFYAYCADYLTPTVTHLDGGHWYRLENVEDSEHYSEEDAAKLRAIVENGYWGTEDGIGSVKSIKALLTEYATSNPKVVVQDKNGKDVEFDLADLIDGLKEHEALAVTQAAVWAYSINREDYNDGVDKVVVVGAQSAIKCYNSGLTSQLSEYRPANNQDNLYAITGLNKATLAAKWGLTVEEFEAEIAKREAEALESDARMKALFDLFMNINPKTSEAESVTTVINEKNNVQNMGFIVKDKAAEKEENKDDNKDNDVYDIDLTFTLAFVPGENDELYVCLLDANGDPILGEDGQPITERLADPSNPDSVGIKPDASGVYTLKGLQIGENSDFTFDLKLSGTQYLENGVYLYMADGGRHASQTLVGMAKGERDVAVHNSMTINFNVDETKHVVAETEWEDEGDPIIIPPTIPGEEDPNPPLDEDPNPPPKVRNRVTVNKTNTETILDEEVPLAAAPKTGDNSIVLIVVLAVLAMGIAATFVFEKKRSEKH